MVLGLDFSSLKKKKNCCWLVSTPALEQAVKILKL